MTVLLTRKGIVPILFTIYLLPRVFVMFLDTQPFSDAGWYFNRAVALASGQGYTEGGVPTAYWPPGWPWVMSLLLRIFGTSLLPIQMFNIACSLAIGWLTLDLGRKLFNSELAGRGALLLLGIYPNSIAYIPLLWNEVFYTTLLLAGCWILLHSGRRRTLVLGGGIFGIATMVKPQSLVIIPFVFAIDFLRGGYNLRCFVLVLTKCAAAVAVALVIVLPWSYRNYQIFGEWVLVSTNGGLTLLTGNNPSARGDFTEDDPLIRSIPRTVETQIEVDKEARHRAIEWIKNYPADFLKLLPLKFYRLWAPDGESEWSFQAGFKNYEKHAVWFRAVRYLNQVYYIFLLGVFVFAGLVLFSEKARIDWWALPYFLAIYQTIIAFVFSGQSRFHYPIMPFIIVCCAWFLVEKWPGYSRR
jgi:4-amino-4-deoxy-L-arabinose transferase-like glycosyltransferase